LEKGELIVSYDKEASMFYVSFGEPRQSITEELDDWVLVRRDPHMHQVAGVTMINLNDYFAQKLEIPTP
jgi:uncharacterized protein YuzE